MELSVGIDFVQFLTAKVVVDAFSEVDWDIILVLRQGQEYCIHFANVGLRKEYLNYAALSKFSFVYLKDLLGRKYLHNFGLFS